MRSVNDVRLGGMCHATRSQHRNPLGRTDSDHVRLGHLRPQVRDGRRSPPGRGDCTRRDASGVLITYPSATALPLCRGTMPMRVAGCAGLHARTEGLHRSRRSATSRGETGSSLARACTVSPGAAWY